ncbi:MAG: DoxX family protein [Thalassotalea sp.]
MTLIKDNDAVIDLISRIFIAAIFALSGLSKAFNYQGTEQYMEMMGVPSILLPLVIVTEVIGALFIMIGYKTRITAFLLAGLCISSALLFHFQLADQNQFIHFFKNLAIAGGFIAIVLKGAGSFSIDNKILNKKAAEE